MTLLWIALYFAALIAAASIITTTLIRGISPMPSTSKVMTAVEQALPKEIKGKVYELGCGFGALAVRIASLHPEGQVHAYEVSPIPWLVTFLRQKLYKQPNMTLHWDDFFRIDLGDATVVFCYLFPGAMERLQKKFEKELKPGTLVISNTFAIPGWEPEQVIKVPDLYRTKVYVYRAP